MPARPVSNSVTLSQSERASGGWRAGGQGEVSELPLKQHDYALHTALGRSRATDAWLDLYLARRALRYEAGVQDGSA